MKRKRRIRVILLMIAALCLSAGCSGDRYDAGSIIASDVDIHSDQLYFIKSLGSAPSMVSSKSGYYFLAGVRNSYLYYTDKATMNSVPLCSKPDCLHGSETDANRWEFCNAYLRGKDTFMLGDLLFYDSNLYYFRSYRDEKEQMIYFLSQISPDGTQRRDVFSFTEHYPQYVIIHDGFLYYSITFFTDETDETAEVSDNSSSKAAVYRVPMDDLSRAPELVFENNSIHANITGLKGYENNVFFNSSGYLDAEMQVRYKDLICYRTDTGIVSKIAENAGRTAVCGGKLVYYIDDELKAVCNLDGSDKRTLENVIGIPYCDDKYLLTDTFAMAARDKNVERRLYAYNLNGKLLQSFGFGEFDGVDIFGSDSSYIFVVTADHISENESNYEYWRIDKRKIESGSAQMEKYYAMNVKSAPD